MVLLLERLVCSGYRPARAMPESTRSPRRRPPSVHRALLSSSEAGGGIALMVAAAAALALANSGLAPAYFATLHAYLGPLSVLHWVNDALMAVFFLLVGLEIKRECSTGSSRLGRGASLPGLAPPAAWRAGRDLCRLNCGTPETCGLGDPDGDRHRLRARRAGAARPPRAGVAQDLPHRPRDHRRSRRRRHHRGLLHRAICPSLASPPPPRSLAGSRGAQQRRRRRVSGPISCSAWCFGCSCCKSGRPRDARRRCPRADNSAAAVARRPDDRDFAAAPAGARLHPGSPSSSFRSSASPMPAYHWPA